MDRALTDEVRMLLWDVDPATADVDREVSRICERVMTRGSLEAMRWLLRTYEPDRLREQLVRIGPSGMPPREFAFWSAVLELEVSRSTSSVGGGRPAWAD